MVHLVYSKQFDSSKQPALPTSVVSFLQTNAEWKTQNISQSASPVTIRQLFQSQGFISVKRYWSSRWEQMNWCLQEFIILHWSCWYKKDKTCFFALLTRLKSHDNVDMTAKWAIFAKVRQKCNCLITCYHSLGFWLSWNN